MFRFGQSFVNDKNIEAMAFTYSIEVEGKLSSYPCSKAVVVRFFRSLKFAKMITELTSSTKV